MSALKTQTVRTAPRERGFTLVELMVTVAIALFLLGGLVMVVQNVRTANLNQQSMAQLQDQQRFAMTVLTDVIQAGGYFTNPTLATQDSALPVSGVFANTGQAFWGTHPGALTPDTLQVRYVTNGNDGIILCDGSTNLVAGSTTAFVNQFTIVTQAPGVPGGLYCQVNNGGASAAAPQLLVTGVQSMTIWYGVKRNAATDDYTVDTYVTADQMGVSALGPDWSNISSVRVQLVFTNPLAGQPGQQPTITFQRVVEVMGRAGIHT